VQDQIEFCNTLSVRFQRGTLNAREIRKNGQLTDARHEPLSSESLHGFAAHSVARTTPAVIRIQLDFGQDLALSSPILLCSIVTCATLLLVLLLDRIALELATLSRESAEERERL